MAPTRVLAPMAENLQPGLQLLKRQTSGEDLCSKSCQENGFSHQAEANLLHRQLQRLRG